MTQQPNRRSLLCALLVCGLFVPVNVTLSVLVVHWRQGQAAPVTPNLGPSGQGVVRHEPSKVLESIAVLPFEIDCRVGEPTEQFEKGVRDAALNVAAALEKNTSLRVIGPDKGPAAKPKEAVEAGRAIGASAILRGRVTIDGKDLLSKEPKERLAASVVLIEVSTGYVLWEVDLVLFDSMTPGRKEEGDLILRMHRIQDAVVREIAGRWPRQ